MERKIRILQFASLDLGGITSLLLNVSEKMDRTRYRFDYLVFRDQEEPAQGRMQALGGRKVIADISGVENNILRGFYKLYLTWKVMKKERPEILQLNASTPYDILIGISARAAGVKKIILHAHNNAAPYRAVRNRMFPLCRFLMPFVTDVWLACSESAAAFMFPRKIYERHAYSIIKNGIDLQKFAFDPALRERYRKIHHCEERLVIGHVGRFCTQKNHEFLLRIFVEVKKREPSAWLFLYGIGELTEQVRAQAASLEIMDCVFFKGGTQRVYEVMQMMDVFVMPSLFEGLPLVAVEAQATGLALVLSDRITREAMLTEDVAYCSLEEDPGVWAEKILELYSRKKEKPRVSETEQVRKAGFDINDTQKRLCRIYDSCIEK